MSVIPSTQLDATGWTYVQGPKELAAFAHACHQLVPLACKYYLELTDEEVAEVSRLSLTVGPAGVASVTQPLPASHLMSEHNKTAAMVCRSTT